MSCYRILIPLLFILFTVKNFAQNNLHYLKQVKLLNTAQDTVSIDLLARPSIILLASENTCSKCYENLEGLLTDDLNLITIIRAPNCVSCRKEFVKKYPVFKKSDSIYFDIHSHPGSFINDPCKDGLFAKAGVCRTPAIIVNNRDQQVIFTHQKLFTRVEVSRKFRKELRKFIRKTL